MPEGDKFMRCFVTVGLCSAPLSAQATGGRRGSLFGRGGGALLPRVALAAVAQRPHGGGRRGRRAGGVALCAGAEAAPCCARWRSPRCFWVPSRRGRMLSPG